MATTKQVRPIDAVRQQLDNPAMRQELSMALPEHVSVEKFNRVAITALQQTPSLLQLDRKSLFASIVSAAQLGLLPDSQLGEAYFVPFKGKVQMIPGYRGLVKLARQSGELATIEAEIIYENDKVEWILGDDGHFKVERTWKDDLGKPIGAYALAKLKDGSLQRVVMRKDQIEQIRKKSSNANGPAWKDNWEEMAKKTAIRRLMKLLPLSTDANAAVRVGELAEEVGRTATVQAQDEDKAVIEGELAEEEIEEQQDARKSRRKSHLDEISSKAKGKSKEAPEEPPEASQGDDNPFQDDEGEEEPKGDSKTLEVDPETGELIE